MSEARRDGARAPAGGWDAGLQPERTRLAWRRTTLACTVAVLLAGRRLLAGGAAGPVQAGLAALLMLVWVAFVALAHRRVREMAAARHTPLTPRIALSAAGCTVALAAFGATIASTH
ncbi:DUF202 domain-containing protein [Streptomyces natalensis]|uniref:DUF202 domain-containing protein n=1 Tax=Streptomyces natalensis ATCC 27448 TaxID=1240678 RepID=A0A0D7CPH3_9ACTN|nr:DUF202 domain-containing protein [Streptomyces natalensis]KIZ17740.1 hypothetical protein SNA_12160 [Streptomyces natalensis ATCC 27448]